MKLETVKSDLPVVRIELAADVLHSVFEECDRHDRDETGGRVIGHFAMNHDALAIRVTGVIEPGPKARRTSTSFFQDGDYQTDVFRRLETRDASIEHLGNWHTHHVNGYPTLSAGDLATYRRIVNHKLHNTDFFYALLVTHRNTGRHGLARYAVRHYVFFRGKDHVHEVPSRDVRLTDHPRIWPTQGALSEGGPPAHPPKPDATGDALAVRAQDQSVLRVLCPSFEPRLTARTGTFFWKGPLSLVDGSAKHIRVVEVRTEDGLRYYPVLTAVSPHVAQLCETPFRSAGDAVRALELQLNREIYDSALRSAKA